MCHPRWQARHPNVRWHYTPAHASWLNRVEIWFSILTRQALRGAAALPRLARCEKPSTVCWRLTTSRRRRWNGENASCIWSDSRNIMVIYVTQYSSMVTAQFLDSCRLALRARITVLPLQSPVAAASQAKLKRSWLRPSAE